MSAAPETRELPNELRFIAARVGALGTGNLSGMATLISSTHAVTCPDIFASDGQTAEVGRELFLHLDWWPQPIEPRRATVVAVDSELGLAVLALKEPIDAELTKLTDEPPGAGADWSCLCILSSAPSGREVTGTVGSPVTVGGKNHLRLHPSGLSGAHEQPGGAPIVIERRLVGIVGGHRLETASAPEWYLIGVCSMAESAKTDVIRNLLGSNLAKAGTATAVADPDADLDENAFLAQPVPVNDWEEQAIAGYRSDGLDGKDMLDIKKEVAVLCSVLAAKDVEPPLSLGLFGAWGSGKSFFMKEMEKWFLALKSEVATQKKDGGPADIPYCKNIVQLWFNAWHYIDTNLWASLTFEIFDGLARELAKDKTQSKSAAREELLAASASSRDFLAEAQRKKSEADQELRNSEERLRQLKLDSEAVEARLSPKEILRAGYRAAIAQEGVPAQLANAARALNIPDVQAAAGEVKTRLLELQGIQGRIRAIWLSLSNQKSWTPWILMVVAGGACLLVPIILAWTLNLNLLGVLGTYVAALVAFVGALSGILSPFIAGAHRALSFIEKAKKDTEEVIKKAQADRENELKEERERLGGKVKDAGAQVDKASAAVKTLELQLDAMQPDRQIADFVKERQESTDYTKHLGVIARARFDFNRLSALLKDANAQPEPEPASPGTDDAAPAKPRLPRVDRIILYIDDLDRCPEDKVVEVLQAVHLLLAFPLFIVVIGVDPRWLLHSLKQHSKAFQDDSSETAGLAEEERIHWQSTPFNYLEKIFQIPFTLRPMNKDGFGNLIENLTIRQDRGKPAQTRMAKAKETPTQTVSDVTPQPAALAVQPSAASEVAKSSVGKPAEPDPAAKAQPADPDKDPGHAAADAPKIDMDSKHLEITEREYSFMQLMHPLIASPRATKRFVNVYRLLRATVREDERAAFLGDGTNGQYRAVILLLAIQTGYPTAATEILREIQTFPPTNTWQQFVVQVKLKSTPAPDAPRPSLSVSARADAENRAQLMQKLRDMSTSLKPDLPCADFIPWVRAVARYSFQSGWVLEAQPAGMDRKSAHTAQ